MTLSTISAFDLKAKLGQGASCQVYRATNTRTGKDVAVKIMDTVAEVEENKVFESEVHALKTMKRHQNVIKLVEAGTATHI